MSYYETPKGTFNRRFDYVHKETPLFSTHEDIQNKKGRFKMARFNYLQALVTEFQDSEDEGNSLAKVDFLIPKLVKLKFLPILQILLTILLTTIGCENFM